MAKSGEKIEARELRKRGESIRDIARILGVSKGSVSLWCQDIVLTYEQVLRLKGSGAGGAHRGRLKIAANRRKERLERRKKMMFKAKRR